MAYTAGNLVQIGGSAPGRITYRYDSEDHPDVVEAAGYFNNKDDDLNLAVGDLIDVVQWSSTPFADGSTVSRVLQMIVTNVISVDAASSAGNVNIAQWGLATGLLSSGT